MRRFTKETQVNNKRLKEIKKKKKKTNIQECEQIIFILLLYKSKREF